MFSTKGQEVKQGGGVQKSLQPGVNYAHIFSASVRESKNTGKKALELVLEGPVLENFEGWTIEKGNENGPKFTGNLLKCLQVCGLILIMRRVRLKMRL